MTDASALRASNRQPLTHERLHELLDYDPATGIFRRKISRPRAKAGDVAGTPQSVGYLQVCIDGRLYYAHRLAWLYVHGEWPPGEIDHVNGVRTDNRLANLRPATRSQNMANVGASRNNRSGFKGVHRNRKRWRAQISVGGKTCHLGYFDTPEDAHAAYAEAAVGVFGAFARAESEKRP